MKLIGVLTVILVVAVIHSYGPGVPTRTVPTDYNTQPITFVEGNKSIVAPATTVNTGAVNPPHGQPGHRCDIKVGQALDSKPSIPSPKLNIAASTLLPLTTPDGLNPKHGQPGHRCDIAVGQPLNSKPATNAATPTANSIASAAGIPAINTMGTPPRLNPKHGQPFHRCDIMVGEPLDSKATPAPAATNSATPAKTNTSTLPAAPTAISPLRSAANTTAPLLNPKHGQPGHRCDVLVGQPLNGRPAYTLPAK